MSGPGADVARPCGACSPGPRRSASSAPSRPSGSAPCPRTPPCCRSSARRRCPTRPQGGGVIVRVGDRMSMFDPGLTAALRAAAAGQADGPPLPAPAHGRRGLRGHRLLRRRLPGVGPGRAARQLPQRRRRRPGIAPETVLVDDFLAEVALLEARWPPRPLARAAEPPAWFAERAARARARAGSRRCPSSRRCRRWPSGSTRRSPAPTLAGVQPLQFAALKTFDARRRRRSWAAPLEGVGRRGKYLVCRLRRRLRLLVHLSQGGRVDVEDPPKTTRPKQGVVRFTLRRPPVRARQGVRHRAQGGVVGARPGRRRARSTALGPEATARRVRRAASAPATTGAGSTPSCATSARSPASAGATPTTPCTAPAVALRLAGVARRPSERERLLDAIDAVLEPRASRTSAAHGRPAHQGRRPLGRAQPPRRSRAPSCGDTLQPGLVRELRGHVLPDLPDRREGARRPPDVQAAEVSREPARHAPGEADAGQAGPRAARSATTSSTSRSGTASAASSSATATRSSSGSRNERPLTRYFPELLDRRCRPTCPSGAWSTARS